MGSRDGDSWCHHIDLYPPLAQITLVQFPPPCSMAQVSSGYSLHTYGCTDRCSQTWGPILEQPTRPVSGKGSWAAPLIPYPPICAHTAHSVNRAAVAIAPTLPAKRQAQPPYLPVWSDLLDYTREGIQPAAAVTLFLTHCRLQNYKPRKKIRGLNSQEQFLTFKAIFLYFTIFLPHNFDHIYLLILYLGSFHRFSYLIVFHCCICFETIL